MNRLVSLGRATCWLLAAIDAVLGVSATFFPSAYLAVAHPGLPPNAAPTDWVVRTGALWLAFLAIELCAAVSTAPARWFFCVALLRWMEVPADLAYGVLARGASSASRAAILAAPVFNAVAGTLLLAAWRRATSPLTPAARPAARREM